MKIIENKKFGRFFLLINFWFIFVQNLTLKEQASKISSEHEQERQRSTANGTTAVVVSNEHPAAVKRVSNGSMESESAAAHAVELQDALDRANRDLQENRQRMNEMTNR